MGMKVKKGEGWAHPATFEHVVVAPFEDSEDASALTMRGATVAERTFTCPLCGSPFVVDEFGYGQHECKEPAS
jgi:hypothetical protein